MLSALRSTSALYPAICETPTEAIYRLTTALTSAEAYEDAYSRLYEQVGSLIARKQIAEEEANRISKFNAEILGHNNPSQRIMYVDRIRTELAEAKMVSIFV